MRRANSGFFEELRDGDFERECIEDAIIADANSEKFDVDGCSPEEMNEIYSALDSVGFMIRKKAKQIN